MRLNRRSFFSNGVAALGALSLGVPSIEAQLIDQHSDWKFDEFDRLLKSPARAKQVYDIRPIADGKFLNNIKNSLNGFHFGFSIPADKIKVVAAMHGPSNMLNFDDSMWEKYRLGEFLGENDPKTGKAATRNLYFRKAESSSNDINSPNSIYQDKSIEALRGRGVQFLSCHTATEEQAHGLVSKFNLKTPAEEIVQDLQAHILPGVLIVPAMVAAISLLQSDGPAKLPNTHFTYITV